MVCGIGSFFELLYLGLQVLEVLFLAFSESSLGRAVLGFPLL